MVHPHRCGENAVQATTRRTTTGSPPQVWGKLCCLPSKYDWQGFTPTGVGKTEGLVAVVAFHVVHPHRCGENVPPLPVLTALWGSPPQVWGKLAGTVAGG